MLRLEWVKQIQVQGRTTFARTVMKKSN